VTLQEQTEALVALNVFPTVPTGIDGRKVLRCPRLDETAEEWGEECFEIAEGEYGHDQN
jgi:hypothetical protein